MDFTLEQISKLDYCYDEQQTIINNAKLKIQLINDVKNILCVKPKKYKSRKKNIDLKDIKYRTFYNSGIYKWNEKYFNINENHFLYFLFYRERIVYIGETQNIRERAKQHYLNKVFDKMVFLVLENKQGAKNYEERLIKKFKPIYNIKHNRN